VHDQAEQKLNDYGKKIAEMEQKYGMDFSTFEKRKTIETHVQRVARRQSSHPGIRILC